MSHSSLVELERFLSSQADSHTWPRLTAQGVLSVNPLTVELGLYVGPTLSFFEGHFPDQPVLPGVVQVHWAGEFAKRLFKVSGFHTLQGAKFNNMVLPDSNIVLNLSYKPEKASVRFVYSEGDATCSVGTFIFDGVNA